MDSATISKGSSKTDITIGEEFDYTLRVDIPTDMTAYDATLKDSIPAQFDIVGSPVVNSGAAVVTDQDIV